MTFNARVLSWMQTRDSAAASITKVEPYGSDLHGDTEGGFYSSFTVEIEYVRADGSAHRFVVEGEDMESLWHSVVEPS